MNVVLIPAFQPNNALTGLVEALAKTADLAIVVVDDGSSPEHQPIFDQAAEFTSVKVLRHPVNLGKGAALKTGIRYIVSRQPDVIGVVTADADGQHDARDIVKVCARLMTEPDSLVLGVRSPGSGMPWRSRFGNGVTRNLLRLVLGQYLSDTQTGLRGIPKALLGNLLEVGAQGYEFELEMLIAAKHRRVVIVEEPIRTIYEPGNPTSHFRPLADFARIYFVLFRYSLIALLTAVVDNSLFFLMLGFWGNIALALAGARLAAMFFNYSRMSEAVFQSEKSQKGVLPRYIALTAVSALLSYAGTIFLASTLRVGVFQAKLLTEALLFGISFAVQRDFVFTLRGPRGKAELEKALTSAGILIGPLGQAGHD